MLSIPAPAYKDAEKLKKICSAPPFEGLESDWSAAYSAYVHHKGDPWTISQAAFAKPIKDKLRDLYGSRKSSGELKRLRRDKHSCCPMCGSGATGTLDHYLPKEEFSEFSIFTKNLVPACGVCNSGSKGRTYKGQFSGQRFIHPYFDTIAKNPIWLVNVGPPYVAPTFVPVPVAGLSTQEKCLVSFHLDKLLGWQFQNQIQTRWANLPNGLRALKDTNGPISPSETAILLNKLYQLEVEVSGTNGWFSALYRGILANPAAINHLHGII